MTSGNELLVERRGALMWVRLNRAEKANALNVSLMESASAALREAERDGEVRAVILSGAGGRVFCAGVDVREKPADGDVTTHRKRRSRLLAALLDGVLACPKPVVAALNGIASGGGAMLALLSDARVAVDNAAISLPEIDLGMPTFSGASIAMQMGGHALATDLVQTGRRMPAAEALARGLLGSVVARAMLETEAARVANALAGKDPHAFAENKRWINRGLTGVLAEARVEHERHRDAAG
jgi:3-hydroxypropionyl-coenzyme A dehydratase